MWEELAFYFLLYPNKEGMLTYLTFVLLEKAIQAFGKVLPEGNFLCLPGSCPS